VCVAVPAGRLKLRDGPVRVANETVHVLPPPEHEAAVVGVYQERPWATWLGASATWMVPNGSNAFGQPFQPGSPPKSCALVHVFHVPIRSGWPKSVPPSSTPTVVPSPA
jgi:hypothetical protein